MSSLWGLGHISAHRTRVEEIRGSAPGRFAILINFQIEKSEKLVEEGSLKIKEFLERHGFEILIVTKRPMSEVAYVFNNTMRKATEFNRRNPTMDSFVFVHYIGLGTIYPHSDFPLRPYVYLLNEWCYKAMEQFLGIDQIFTLTDPNFYDYRFSGKRPIVSVVLDIYLSGDESYFRNVERDISPFLDKTRDSIKDNGLKTTHSFFVGYTTDKESYTEKFINVVQDHIARIPDLELDKDIGAASDTPIKTTSLARSIIGRFFELKKKVHFERVMNNSDADGYRFLSQFQ